MLSEAAFPDEIDLFRRSLFLFWNANWKSFISLDVFCVAKGERREIYVDVLKQWQCKNVINSLIFLHASFCRIESFRRRLDEHSVQKSHESSANHHSTIDNSVEITIIGSNSIPCARYETTITGAQWNNKINDDENAGWRSMGRSWGDIVKGFFSPIMFDGEKFAFMCCSSWFMFETWFLWWRFSSRFCVKQMLFFLRREAKNLIINYVITKLLQRKVLSAENRVARKCRQVFPGIVGEKWKINVTLPRTFSRLFTLD